MAARDSQKNMEMAAYLKERGIRRTTGACPMHCGAHPRIGGDGLLNHLRGCQGGGTKKRLRLIRQGINR